MYQGRIIRCDAPGALKNALHEVCYEARAADLRPLREVLRKVEGVTSVEPAGASLHLFADSRRAPLEVLKRAAPGAEFRQITPSLEDVFIALVRKEEAA
jgi:hypothetical protein